MYCFFILGWTFPLRTCFTTQPELSYRHILVTILIISKKITANRRQRLRNNTWEARTTQINTSLCTRQININNHHLYSFCPMSSRLFSALSNVLFALDLCVLPLPPPSTHTHTTSILRYIKYSGSSIDIPATNSDIHRRTSIRDTWQIPHSHTYARSHCEE